VLSEFGGIAVVERKEECWAYSHCQSPEEFGTRFSQLLEVVRSLELLAGFCYTQFADTYQEVNGLLEADRTPKLALERIAAAVTGSPSGVDETELPPEERTLPLLEPPPGTPFEEDGTIIMAARGRTNPARG
jgi:hypothetical protein